MALTRVQSALLNTPHVPGGRLTLTSATPVMTSDVSNATTVYYALYTHDRVPVYDGTHWRMQTFTELSNSLSDTTKNPAAAAASKNYDLFVWDDAGTLRLGRGPAWSSDTARGTGAGTTELERVNGMWMNKIAITNGPAADRGLYVGTIRTDSSAGQVDWELGGKAANGDPGFLYVWNTFNRVRVALSVHDSTDTWTNSTDGWRSLNGSTTNRVSFVRGLDEDAMIGQMNCIGDVAYGAAVGWGVGLDSTTTVSGNYSTCYNASVVGAGAIRGGGCGEYSGVPGLGLHYLQALDFGTSAVVGTLYGDAGTASMLSGLHVNGWF